MAPIGTNRGNGPGEAHRLGIRYRAEYRYIDGELAHQKEGDDESTLLMDHSRRLNALPPITITTVYTSSTTKERSNKKKEDKTDDKKEDKTKGKTDEKSKDKTEDKKEDPDKKDDDALPEDFANSRASRKYMTIHSEKLLNVLRDVVSYYPSCTLLGDEFEVYEPYQIFWHHGEELRAYKSKHPQWHDEAYREECNRHIDILLTFLDNNYGKAIRDEEDRWARKYPVCTFEYLWLLFKPGEACYLDNKEGTNPYITQRIMPFGGLIGNKANKYAIQTWNIDYDGHEMGRCLSYVWIVPFDGEKEIKSLKYYPIRFYNESQESIDKHGGRNFHQRLVARGGKFWDLAKEGACYREYNGESTNYAYKKVQGRVVVHPTAYFNRSEFEKSDRGAREERPLLESEGYDIDPDDAQESKSAGCQCQSCTDHPGLVRHGRFDGFHGLDPDEATPPEDEIFFFLCNHRTFAFVLKNRIWESVHVEKVVEVTEQSFAFDHLVLPKDVKYTLQAISCSYVKAQDNSRTQGTDIIKDKGEGKIFLLHGPPGTGKTLSAEVVAELTKRPLLSLTCGDLGTTAEEVELRLGRYMYLGEVWGAVVLLDDADIYLEARAISEVKRNSLVSVFLRALEYYKGLLFLTTNRVNTFDEAFKSRIHIALEYKRLTDEYRRVIWKNNMDRLISDRVNVTETARNYAYFDNQVLGLEFNGREIRNALQTAISLAEFEAEDEGKDSVTIKSAHLKRIVALSASFQGYIASMHRNKPDSYVAKKKQLRNDYYREAPSNKFENNPIRKSKYVIPEDYAETPGLKTRRRDARKVEDEDDDDAGEVQWSEPQKGYVKKSSRAMSEEEEELPRSRSQQSKQKARQIAPIEEEESEEEAPKPKKSTRRAPRSDEEESEEIEASKTKKTAKKPAKKVSQDAEEEEKLPRPTELSRKPVKSVPMHERDDEEEEEVPRANKPTKRSTKAFNREEEENENESRSPARAKKGVGRKTKKVISESDEE